MNLKEIKKQKEILDRTVEEAVRNEVNKLFNRHKNLVEFHSQMGSNFFTDNKGENISLIEEKGMNKRWEYIYGPTYKTFGKLIEIFNEYDNCSIGITVRSPHQAKAAA